MSDARDLITMSMTFDPLIRPVFDEAIRALDLPRGSRGLDAGCGIGLQAMMLAEAVGSDGHVTGLDLSAESVECAEGLVRDADLSARLSFRQGDVTGLPFEDGAFDWAWSAHCVGYASAIDPVGAVREMARVVRPGGRVILLAWSSEQLLPGHPLLEARLRATAAGIAPFVRGLPPERHYLRALGWFREVGLLDGTTQTFVREVQAPLDADVRQALVVLFEMRWPEVETELAPEDLEAFRRLCSPDSLEFIADHPDYVAWFTCTMFSADKAGG
jgi:demethylmenaquinone methyltransferase/2-methoxy-6-polyprenyl-1,4-benzoquinol methylase